MCLSFEDFKAGVLTGVNKMIHDFYFNSIYGAKKLYVRYTVLLQTIYCLIAVL